MPRLLIVHHTPSPHCQEMFEAVVAGATDPEIEGVEVVRRPALTVSPIEMLEADGYLLGTPANLGYMQRRPQARVRRLLLPVPRRHAWATLRLVPPRQRRHRGCRDGVTAITTGLGWVKAAEYVVVMGKPTKDDVEACWNLGATIAAQLMEG